MNQSGSDLNQEYPPLTQNTNGMLLIQHLTLVKFLKYGMLAGRKKAARCESSRIACSSVDRVAVSSFMSFSSLAILSIKGSSPRIPNFSCPQRRNSPPPPLRPRLATATTPAHLFVLRFARTHINPKLVEPARNQRPLLVHPSTPQCPSVPAHTQPSHGRRQAGGLRSVPCRRAAPRLQVPLPGRVRAPGAGVGASRGGPARGGGGRRRRGRAAGGGGARGAEAVGAADVPGGGGDVQPRHHVHGRRRRLLPLRLADGGRRDPGHGNGGHLRAFGGRRGGDGVLGAVGAPCAVARVAVAHARVPPPAPRRAIRAQRRLRHRQRRAGHVPPRLRLLQPGARARAMLRSGPGDHAVRDGVHVRARRPRPPPLPSGPHRERALLPPCRRRPSDTPHGQVPGRALRPLPRPQGAQGGGRDRGAGEGDQQEDQEERDLRCHPIRSACYCIHLKQCIPLLLPLESIF